MKKFIVLLLALAVSAPASAITVGRVGGFRPYISPYRYSAPRVMPRPQATRPTTPAKPVPPNTTPAPAKKVSAPVKKTTPSTTLHTAQPHAQSWWTSWMPVWLLAWLGLADNDK